MLPTTALLNSTFRGESERQLYHTIKIQWEFCTPKPRVFAQLSSAILKSRYVRKFIVDFEHSSNSDQKFAYAVRDALAAFTELQELDIFSSHSHSASLMRVWMPAMEQ